MVVLCNVMGMAMKMAQYVTDVIVGMPMTFDFSQMFGDNLQEIVLRRLAISTTG